MILARNSRGFTLIEILVVASLMVLMSAILIRNFSSSRFDFDRLANQVAASIRQVQTYSLAAKKWSGTFRCGYGLTYVDNATYNLYGGRDTTVGCAPSFAFSSSGTTPIVQTIILDSRIEILSFQDLFYLPPDPRLYIGSSLIQQIAPSMITLRKRNASNCNSAEDCRFICYYPTGRIEVYKLASLCN